MKPSPALVDLLGSLRHHSAFPELKQLMRIAPPKPFRPSRFEAGESLEKIGALHAYESGVWQEYSRWIMFLAGEDPQKGHNESTSNQEKS